VSVVVSHVLIACAAVNTQVDAAAGTTFAQLFLNPEIRVESWYGTTVSVYRGPLMYSLNIPANFTVLNTYPYESRDYQVRAVLSSRSILSVMFRSVLVLVLVLSILF
jgi:hypothetical protein